MTIKNESSEKTKSKIIFRNKNFISQEKVKLKSSSKNKSKIIKSSTNSTRNDKNIVYTNKNIIIKDITKNYNNINSNLHKAYNDKIKKLKINKLNTGDISLDLIKLEYNRLNKKAKETNIMNKTFSNFKLNNSISNYNSKKNRKIFKPSLDNIQIKSIEKKKITNDIIKNKNKKNKIGCGDSYEFNFTFNNYNNNYTQNNFNGNGLKSSEKKRKKITIENSNNEIINDFTSVKNNIIKDIKDIINNNKNKKDNEKENSKQNSKVGKIGVIRKNKKINRDKNIYAIKIQKIFRGYIFRKNNKLINKKNSKEKLNNNNRVYIKKKILNKKSGLNIAINYNLSNHQKDYYFTETNLPQTKTTDNNISNIIHGNKIEEIIIDNKKLFNVLGPSGKRKDYPGIKINSGYNFGI